MFKHMLLPTDGSPASGRAIAQAVTLAKSADAKITGLHVMPEFQVLTCQPQMLEDTCDQFMKECQASADAFLSALKSAADQEGVACETVCVTSDFPHKAIVRMAEGKRCDVIVMASHGRKGITGFLLGSETRKVLSHTKNPCWCCTSLIGIHLPKEIIMTKNTGAADRALRIVAGLVILSLYFVVEPAYRWWALLGLVPLLTGAVGWCPAYTLLGIKTCETVSK